MMKNFIASGAILACCLTKPGATAGTVAVATAATDLINGVSDELGADDGGRIDVHKSGIVPVTAGAAFSAGAPLTATAGGKAILAAPAAGANVRIIGFAEEAAVADGDIVNVLFAPGVIQG